MRIEEIVKVYSAGFLYQGMWEDFTRNLIATNVVKNPLKILMLANLLQMPRKQ